MLEADKTLEWHNSRLDLSKMTFTAVGDVQHQHLTQLLHPYLEDWPQSSWNPPDLSWAGTLKKGIFFIDLPQEQQSTLRVLIPAWKTFDQEPALRAQTLSIAMGGSFTSRLNNKLREEKGYTYGASCYFSQNSYGNILRVATSVQRDATAEALQDLLLTLKSAEQGFTAEEWQKSRNTLRTNIISSFGRLSELSSTLDLIVRYGRPLSFFDTQLKKLAALPLDPPTDLAPYFNPDNGVILIVGDGTYLRDKLSGMKYTELKLENFK